MEAVYTVAFNPTGTFLATGSPDHTINIWRVQVSWDELLLDRFLNVNGDGV
jgi:WD40 repeat protein